MESRACQVLSHCKILTHQLTVPQPWFWEDTYQPVPRHLLWAQGVNSSCDLHAFLTPTCPNYSQLQEWVLEVFFFFYTEEMLYNFFSLENAAEMNIFWILGDEVSEPGALLDSGSSLCWLEPSTPSARLTGQGLHVPPESPTQSRMSIYAFLNTPSYFPGTIQKLTSM